MAYCRKCGNEIYEQDVKCPECGERLKYVTNEEVQKGNIGFAFLGFFIPIVGIVLFIAWNKERPKDAKYSLIGSLVSIPFVIIVTGIIAAFFIPAVGAIVDNTQRSSVYADALAVEQAAELYCADTLCGDGTDLFYSEISAYLMNFDESYYELSSDPVVAQISNEGIHVHLEAAGTGNYEFISGLIPTETTRDDSIVEDTN